MSRPRPLPLPLPACPRLCAADAGSRVLRIGALAASARRVLRVVGASRASLATLLVAGLSACVGTSAPDDEAAALRGRAPLLDAAQSARREAAALPEPTAPHDAASAPAGAAPAAEAPSAPASAGGPSRPLVSESHGYAVRWVRPLQRRAEADGVEVVDDARGALRLVVTSSQGIGAAELRPLHGVWPRAVQMQFQYAEGRPFDELEGLRVQVSPWAHQNGDEPPGPPPDGFVVWQRGGTLRVVMPPGWLRQRDTLRIAWVDRYRR